MPRSIHKLLLGYSRFRKKFFQGKSTLYTKLSKHGQKPIALVIACCDSRVDPAIILDRPPGDLFVVRNVANLVPPYENDQHYHGTSAALEFGVCSLNIPNIIILGHSQCGGINSLLQKQKQKQNQEQGAFIKKWMDLALPSSDTQIKHLSSLSAKKKAEIYGRLSLSGSLNNLMTFPWIRERVESKKLALHAWYFTLSKGTLDVFNHETNEFKTIK